MKNPKSHRRLGRRTHPSSARPVSLIIAALIIAFTPSQVVAEAPDTQSGVQASANTEGEASRISKDYQLAPGDRVNIVVYDQPQLSGQFIVDGGGGILLPLAGAVSLSGLTLAEAQKLIQDRFADGVLVHPAVSVRITDYRPIFVTGNVRKPGSYRFSINQSVKAAIAAAGGEGDPIELTFNGAMSEFITTEQRLRQLEADQAALVMRKARLEAQRDGQDNFVIPRLVGLSSRNVDFDRAYSVESDIFSRLAETYRIQIQALQSQRPRLESEVNAVTSQIEKQKEHLSIVSAHLVDLELLFRKGLLRKDVLLNEQIQKTMVEGQISNFEAQLARLRQNAGELDIKLGDIKANYLRQILSELQDTSQRLREVDVSLGPTRRLLEIKAKATRGDVDESENTISISRVRDGAMVTFDATEDMMLSPGDVVEVKLKPRVSDPLSSFSTQATRELESNSSVTTDIQPTARRNRDELQATTY
jgi:polysaccharide export outer membrane protein